MVFQKKREFENISKVREIQACFEGKVKVRTTTGLVENYRIWLILRENGYALM